MKRYVILIMGLMPTFGHAMQRPDKPTVEGWEREEDELLKKMAQIRLEQARQELQKMRESNEQPDGRNKTTPEFIHELRKYKKELEEKEKDVTGTEPKKLSFFVIHSPSSDCIEQHKKAGYLVFEYHDGITGFCLPGHEHELNEQLILKKQNPKK